MLEIVKVKQINFTENTDWLGGVRMSEEKLFVAEISDGTNFYTSVGGTDIYGTFDEIHGGQNITELHDFTNKHFDDLFINNEETFRNCVNEMLKVFED
jgi:hypothetical protein